MTSSTTNKKGNNAISSEKYLSESLIASITNSDVPVNVTMNAILAFRNEVNDDWAFLTCSNGCNIAHLVVESKKITLAKKLFSHPSLSKGAESMIREKKKFKNGQDAYKDALTIAIMQVSNRYSVRPCVCM